MVTAAKAVTNDMRMSDVIDVLSGVVVGVAGVADPNVRITLGRVEVRMDPFGPIGLTTGF